MYLQTSSDCRYCGAAISPNEQRLGSVCRGWRCRRSQLDDDLRQFRDEQAKTEGRIDADRFVPVVVPYSPRDLTPLPPERRRLFLEYLDALIRGQDPELPDSVRAAINAAARASSTTVEKPESETLCAACRGVCCQDGELHAFLDSTRVREILAESCWTGDELRAQFASFFPEVSTENGCVFQAEDGCQVPREMRSHLCNRYACAGLKRAEELVEGGATRLFAAARADNLIESGVFLVLEDEDS